MAEKTVTLSEEAYNNLKSLADLTIKVANNKETRREFVKSVKKLEPDRRFPDVEMEEFREEMKAEREKEKQEAEAAKVLKRIARQRDGLKDRYKDEDIAEIEKLMEKKGISDYEDGAVLYGATIQASKPTYDVKDHTWEMPKIELKDMGNLPQRRRSSILSAIDEIQRNRKG